MSGPHVILWRRMDQPGHGAARLESIAGEWHLRGTSVPTEAGSCSGGGASQGTLPAPMSAQADRVKL